MNAIVERPFVRMGARVKIEQLGSAPGRAPVQLDVRRDGKGEYFMIRHAPVASVQVLDCRPGERHLLLLSRVPDGAGVQKSRFLMGHDERHWFVAAIPESTRVSTVAAAKQALKPDAVVATEKGLRRKQKHLRSNKARVRQGEWFFIPVPEAVVAPFLVLKHEPLRRGGGKPHMAEELYREGGETVYVSRQNPNGLTESEYRGLPESTRSRRVWRMMRRNMRVLVRGRIRHPDHATIVLHGWHEVFMNTETRAQAMQNVAFLD